MSFNNELFADTGVIPDGNTFKIEYTAISNLEGGAPTTVTVVTGGTLTYVHNWTVNDKNYAEHICANCSQKGKHSWTPDKNNSAQHKCTVCRYAEAHYGGTADCNGKAKCAACGKEYKKNTTGKHDWEVIPGKIGATSAEYECNTCRKVEEQKISSDANTVDIEGKKLKVILQDPYKVLPDGTQLSSKAVTPGSARHNELLGQMDNIDDVLNLAFFEIELFKSDGKQISGQIAGKVRILLQIPDGWDKRDLEAVLIMDGVDIEFEESVITIDGVDYLAFWTDHFSPYALIEESAQKEDESTTNSNTEGSTTSNNANTSPATGNTDFERISALAVASAAVISLIVYGRKRRIE